jgi:hypothetical protein
LRGCRDDVVGSLTVNVHVQRGRREASLRFVLRCFGERRNLARGVGGAYSPEALHRVRHVILNDGER